MNFQCSCWFWFDSNDFDRLLHFQCYHRASSPTCQFLENRSSMIYFLITICVLIHSRHFVTATFFSFWKGEVSRTSKKSVLQMKYVYLCLFFGFCVNHSCSRSRFLSIEHRRQPARPDSLHILAFHLHLHVKTPQTGRLAIRLFYHLISSAHGVVQTRTPCRKSTLISPL